MPRVRLYLIVGVRFVTDASACGGAMNETSRKAGPAGTTGGDLRGEDQTVGPAHPPAIGRGHRSARHRGGFHPEPRPATET